MAQKSAMGGLQGYLEKNSGLMKAKAKFWCCLDGHTMELFKNDKKVYVVESLNLTDAQTVRKVNSDKTGVQFEIIMKKNKRYIFTALTANECSTWIKELQNLMVAQPVADISRFDRLSMGDTGTYSSIDDVTDSGADNTAETVSDSAVRPVTCSSDYAEIEEFSLKRDTSADTTTSNPDMKISNPDNTTPNHSVKPCVADSEEDAADVVIRRSRISDVSSLYTKIKDVGVHSAATDSSAEQDQTTEGMYSTAKTSTTDLDQTAEDVYSEATSGSIAEPDPAIKDTYATINKKGKTSQKGEEIVNNKAKTSDQDKEISDKVLDVFENLNFTKPTPLIPLTDEDYKPIQELKQFLDNNKEMCRYSYSIVQPGEDPIQQMKDLLSEIS